MRTETNRAGGAIPRPFVFALAALLGAGSSLITTPARADLGSIDEYPAPAMGRASFYGPGFAGRKTASGAIFRPEQLTAAHRTLPLGTRVRVTNLSNGQSVLVTINDRGPYIRGRHIDLSVAAARAIGMLHRGVAEVVIDIL
jgi:rare lipoprotein A